MRIINIAEFPIISASNFQNANESPLERHILVYYSADKNTNSLEWTISAISDGEHQ